MRNLIILTMSLVTAVCCTRQSIEPYQTPHASSISDNPISLNVSGNNQTRTIISDSNIPDSYTIFLSSYASYKNHETDDNYFVSKAFNNAGTIWRSNPVVYWPLGSKLDFLSLCCENEITGIEQNAYWYRGNSTLGMEINVPNDRCNLSEMLFSSAFKQNAEDNDGCVDLIFKHSQHWLHFAFESNEEGNLYQIDSVVLEKIYTGGTLRIGNGIYLFANWDYHGFKKKDTTVPNSQKITTESGKNYCDILVPEQDASDIIIYYHKCSSESASFDEGTAYTARIEARPDPWFYGEKTIYLFSFKQNNTIMLSIKVKPWDTDTLELDFSDGQLISPVIIVKDYDEEIYINPSSVR